ncbi:glutamine-hydrolyzing carbamoyl-phosphate synthase small subunit [Desulfosporosinus sp.]|uniref:glutamine-hydrolyzing carbamoyl-phosphate synthase small subunit n=1 Tax=Desulfosporosinus sp. TaxID=157907 RepID=UPI000E8CBA93|nr:glutamine-hydrolyzing carbamoyl-phosphate synthase small subunit [Desulfosporosinus sp.]MBC2721243.1 glutamine-hydrolyzing carbamoyl-phosphate synthase small subunit [Desulfosporosinus sp.]MBC2728675.1 glutamine-hydrolyzing carbamoyl-phosphate synthase small subunit [Desulfosporosinus sp.]HBV88503.1 carbamoyl phosphate synthase small subunit [Desulfosporosinus sp.]
MKAALVLETGKILLGESFGATGEAFGEVVFNTGMTGYQEVLTDPSYAGQMVCMTYPLIGNYGINRVDDQSDKPQVQGFIVKEAARNPSHWQMEKNISRTLAQSGVVGIKGIDTRALTRIIREHGVLRGVITTEVENVSEWVPRLKTKSVPSDVVKKVSTPKIYTLPAIKNENEAVHVVVMDFGIKRNILQAMQESGFQLTVVPYSTSAEQIMKLQPDGVFLSNGPGDPKEVAVGIETIQGLLGKRPIFGICLGHQLLSLALGGDTYKMKFGHRGGNQPVQDLESKRVTITSQNHGYAISEESLNQTPLYVTHRNLNDQSVEGVKHRELPVFSVQYHPEAGPGPSESLYLFEEFAQLMQEWRAGYAS